MQPSQQPDPINPYAPPKAALDDSSNTTYLNEDGYAFQNELIANHHFKSPLICAKLGTPIPPETNPKPKKITIKRVPGPHTNTFNIFSTLGMLALIFWFIYTGDFNNVIPAIIIFAIAASPIKRQTTKPYQIPFYLSEKYTHIRKRRHLIFITILTLSLLTFITGLITQNPATIGPGILATAITLIIYKFKTTLFIVTQTKGEFHYIRGAHQNLLNALPHLPLSQ
ncbi:MAG: hypothetical protein ACSHX6_16555 [Akkermansiaceae bacterium]